MEENNEKREVKAELNLLKILLLAGICILISGSFILSVNTSRIGPEITWLITGKVLSLIICLGGLGPLFAITLAVGAPSLAKNLFNVEARLDENKLIIYTKKK